MTEQEIIELLDRLEEYQAQSEEAKLRYNEQRDAIIPPEVKQALEDVDYEYRQRSEAVAMNIENVTGQIKKAVTAYGASVKASGLHAVYSAGRVTWDNKGLSGYAVAHPEIEAFKKVGEPSVSIRGAK